MNRRGFLETLAISGAVFLSGKSVSAAEVLMNRSKVKLRFIVASDGHYGQAKTDFNGMHDVLVNQVNVFSSNQKVDFCVINGDLFHDKPEFLPLVKQKLDGIKIPYFVTKGNHDLVTDQQWAEVWKMPTNHSVVIKDNAILLGNTSNIKGEYISPDLEWMKASLDQSKKHKNAFIFLHIPQINWDKNCVDNPKLTDMFKAYPNIKAVFHGHIHSLDEVRHHEGIPYLFDAHFGGNWGTPYKGFRVVEVMKDNSVLTYMMNPTDRILEAKL